MKYSIIIVTYSAFDYLERCLDSLFSTREDEDCEVIIVDNTPGNHDLETMKLLNGADKLYKDGKNHGFAEGCNIGAGLATGEYLVFLNPDTEVFPGWLEGMEKYFARPPAADPTPRRMVGAVGPISNFVAGLQRADFHMQPAESPAETAERAAQVLAGRALETRLLIGFCLMTPRSVWDEMGGMDAGCFLGSDDLDLSWRLRLAGYELLIASDVFVYHAGHKSFESRPEREVRELNRKSEEHLRQKLLTHYQGNPPSAVELWGADMMNTAAVRPLRLSVMMIVREEEENLRDLLPQLAFADEVVLVDTRPDCDRDMDPQFLEEWAEYKAPALDGKVRAGVFPWVDDFAAARNHALSLCTGDYVLWLDADDRVPEVAAQQIRAAMDRPGQLTHGRKAYFRFQVEDMGASGQPAHIFSQPRLFPRVDGLRWEGRIHESLVPAAMRLFLVEVPTDITIRHTGYADTAKLAGKAARNLRILAQEPPSPARHWNTGNVHGMVGEWEKALEEYRKALDGEWLEPLQDAFRDQVRYQAARALFNLGRYEDMAPYIDQNVHPDAPFMAGRLFDSRGARMDAIAAFRQYLDATAKPFFWPWDTDHPTLRPGAFAAMLVLLEAEFKAQEGAFRTQFPALHAEATAE